MIVDFTQKCRLLKLFADKTIKNLVDYAVCVEVDLEARARKNRSGTAMDTIIGIYVKTICKKLGFECKTQALAETNQIRIRMHTQKDM